MINNIISKLFSYNQIIRLIQLLIINNITKRRFRIRNTSDNSNILCIRITNLINSPSHQIQKFRHSKSISTCNNTTRNHLISSIIRLHNISTSNNIPNRNHITKRRRRINCSIGRCVIAGRGIICRCVIISSWIICSVYNRY